MGRKERDRDREIEIERETESERERTWLTWIREKGKRKTEKRRGSTRVAKAVVRSRTRESFD